LLRSASIAQRRLVETGGGDAAFYEAKILSARFYADYVLSQSAGLAHGIMHGAAGALAESAL
jgi:hypothetical protein